MAHGQIYVNLSPHIFAVLVVAGMLSAGVILGVVVDFVMSRMGLRLSARKRQ